MNQNLARQLRTLLILGRVSNLPTVWSDCLAAWWLAGGQHAVKLWLLLPALSAMYLGGMFLNDAFDAEFDRQRRAGRPIPSGQISVAAVWGYGWSWLVLGTWLLFEMSRVAGHLGVALVLCIFLYNQTHKVITASPWLMGLCRFWVYVIAGTTGSDWLDGRSIWGGLVLAFYIVGLSFVARQESFRSPVPHWPLLLLAAPFGLALIMNQGEYRMAGLWVAAVLALWVCQCVRPLFIPGPVNVGRVVSGLLAGIVFVDWLAVGPDCPRWLSLVFLLLFGATQLFQQRIPAT